MKKMIYLACPYSHPDERVRLARFQLVTMVAARMVQNGKLVYSPITATVPMAEYGNVPGTWTFWEPYDSAFIERSDEVAVLKLKGWDQSVGVKAEVKLAARLRMPISSIDPRDYGILDDPVDMYAPELARAAA